MATVEVKCPYCGSSKVIECGKSKSGKQRSRCKNRECTRKIFQLGYRNNGCKGVNGQIADMAVNASGIWDIFRVPKITTDKIISTLRKQRTNSVVLT